MLGKFWNEREMYSASVDESASTEPQQQTLDNDASEEENRDGSSENVTPETEEEDSTVNPG
jgi:hypothetical protein